MSIVYILYIVSLPYARDMHGKEFFFVRYRTCDLADNGSIPVWLQYDTKKMIPRIEGYQLELLTLNLKGERIL